MPLTGLLRVVLLVAEGDLVELGDGVGLDRSQSLAEALSSLPKELERVRGWVVGSGAIRISPMLLDEVSLQGCGDLVGRLQSVVDGPVPCGVVNHVASVPRSLWIPADEKRRSSPEPPSAGGDPLPTTSELPASSRIRRGLRATATSGWPS